MIISAVVALLVSNLINHSDALLYSVQLSVTVQARDYALIISTGVLAGLCGPLLLTLMNACHRGFVSLKLAPPPATGTGRVDRGSAFPVHTCSVGQRL